MEFFGLSSSIGKTLFFSALTESIRDRGGRVPSDAGHIRRQQSSADGSGHRAFSGSCRNCKLSVVLLISFGRSRLVNDSAQRTFLTAKIWQAWYRLSLVAPACNLLNNKKYKFDMMCSLFTVITLGKCYRRIVLTYEEGRISRLRNLLNPALGLLVVDCHCKFTILPSSSRSQDISIQYS